MESLVHTLLSNALAAMILAVAAALLGRTCRRPALTHSLWLLVLLKLITPPLVPVPLPVADVTERAEPRLTAVRQDSNRTQPALARALLLPQVDEQTAQHSPSAMTSRASATRAQAKPERPTPDSNPRPAGRLEQGTCSALIIPDGLKWENAVLVVVLTGALCWWTLAMVRIVRFQRALRDVEPVSREWQARTEDLAMQLGLGRAPSVWMAPGLIPPMLWAIGSRPRLLVPSQLWSTMSSDERASLLLHELAHLKRRDHWVRWLEFIVTGLYWWHPVVWLGCRALREAEEQCCDAWVVWAMPRGARTYAAALLAALEFVSGARSAPAVAPAIGANGHVSCLKRRLRMIMRAKTPRGLSWAGRFAVLGTAAILLPLAPSWAQKSDAETPVKERRQSERKRAEIVASSDRQTQPLRQQNAMEHLATMRKELLDLQSQKRKAHAALRALPRGEKLEQELAALDGIERRLMQEVRAAQDANQSLTETLALKEIQDRDKKDDVEDKLRDSAERFQDQLKDLIEKLGKEVGPVGEEICKALERAVGEVHKSLEKEGFSAEELGKALERSGDELRKAFESGGKVDEKLRDAIDRSRDEIQGALDRARDTVRDQVEGLRESARELTDQDRTERERGRADAPRGSAREDAERLNRQELENARREIRQLEQQLRRATRRVEELERRELRRGPVGRREATPRPAPSPRPTEPQVEPVPPQLPRAPATPARPVRPIPPGSRRVQPPARFGPGGGRRAPEADSDRRLRELEDKMDRLLDELKSLKDEKTPKPGKESSSRDARPSTPSSPIVL
jgi:beta-lactamase regulating signal transducer with metallopeptidase domain